ncbi:Peptidase family M48 [Pseudoxanthomonas sp. GM95]|uniref:M48 family metallopeptidase n=1 Tax=Pseudoxanthomonas sp. GM95 TaxID=1881043 RepID=UPI0008CCD92E|nr:M48 family metallopeptidase [Pseudoxanthomonas sp. GM95]SEM24887.1 Peptidase family M48 [Pseudoxanthomonas sp. GM95]
MKPSARRLVPALAASLIAVLVASCATTTSSTGRRQNVGAVSQQQLDQLGAQAFAEAKQKQKVSSDPKQNAYVRCVVTALVAQLPAEQRSISWETAVFIDDEANAFALPGGKVGVNTGMFPVAKSQDQLAAVIGHEIGHVIERHFDERITNQVRTSQALALLGALAGDYGSLVSQGGGIAANTGFLLPNSRRQETEADEVGQRLMAQAGFDPRQAVNLWQNMLSAGGSRPPQWLSTHPDPQARIRELQGRAGALVPTWEAARAAGRTPRCS